MNIVNSTANKVMELEKRLDNELYKSNLKVSELKHDFKLINLIDPIELDLMTFDGTNSSADVVLQGEIRLRVNAQANIRVTLLLDGYEIYTRIATYPVAVHSISVLRAIVLAPGVAQKLVMRLENVGNGVVQLGTYNFFVWGYGDTFSVSSDTSEPKLSGTTDGNGNYALFLVSGKDGYCYTSTQFPENLEFGDFKNFGAVKSVACQYYAGALYVFSVTENGDLVISTGTTLDETAMVVDSGVNVVTVATVENENKLVVVYSKGSEVNYFTYDGETRSESILIYTFDELVTDVALVQNCKSTTFLAVGLNSGKNYLFSSVTSVTSSQKSSLITASASVSFE